MFSDDKTSFSMVFSMHALRRMHDRKISLDKVPGILSNPLGVIYIG